MSTNTKRDPGRLEGEGGPSSGQTGNASNQPNASAQMASDQDGFPEHVGTSKLIQKDLDAEQKLPHLPLVSALSVASVKITDVIKLSDVSVRLRNCVTRASDSGNLPVQTIGEYLDGFPEAQIKFFSIPCFGRKCAQELTDVIRRWEQAAAIVSDPIDLGNRVGLLQFVREAVVEENLDDAAKEIVREPETAIRNFLQRHLEERHFDVLNRRYGIDRTRRQTLEEIAEGYGVTRERIRQIEVKAIKRCQVPTYHSVFQAFLETQRDEILSAVGGGASIVSLDDAAGWHNVVTGLQRFAIKVLYDDFESWLDAHLELVRRDGHRAGWVAPDLDLAKRHQLEQWIGENTAGTRSLRRRIRNVVYSTRWPVTISYLHDNMPDVPEHRLLTCLQDEMGAELENGVITTIKHLPTSTRVILVLRDAGRPLHVSDVRARHNKMFGFDIEEHAAGAVLQRLEEALIVERGTYDLYENLGLDKDAVQTIRDASVSYLREKGHFLSAKILRRYLAEELPSDVNSHLTPYMLLGICQDDLRFAIRRGLMIGLAQEGFEETFTSLTDTIHDVVREHGPVSIADIRKHISHQREVLDVSINMILQNSPEILMPERGLYDVVEQVIGDDAQIERLSSAIQIALIDQPTSLPILTSRLAAVGYSYSSATIFSFLRNAGFVSRAGLVFQLTTPDPLVAAYNEKFHEIFDSSKDGSLNRAALTEALQNRDGQALIPLDYRLVMNPVAWNNAQSGSDDDADFLDELMSEFEF